MALSRIQLEGSEAKKEDGSIEVGAFAAFEEVCWDCEGEDGDVAGLEDGCTKSLDGTLDRFPYRNRMEGVRVVAVPECDADAEVTNVACGNEFVKTFCLRHKCLPANTDVRIIVNKGTERCEKWEGVFETDIFVFRVSCDCCCGANLL